MVGFATLPETGMPIFCFSAMSSHTKNLLQDPRASLTVTEPAFEGAADARAIFTGNVVPLKGADADAARKAYIAAHPTAFWANFGDFKMYGFKEILDVSFVGGFARAGGVTPEEYVAAAVDPCQAFAEPVMEHMNDDHATSLQQYVEVLVGLPPVRKATMKRFDRFGIDVRCEDAVSGQGGIIRVPFETEVTERKAIKGAIVGLSKKCAALQPDWKPWAPPEKKQMAISALLFDCDGVIADTEPDGHRPAFNAAFKEKGFPDVWTKEHYGELLETGGGKERMTAHWNEVGWPSGYEDEEKQQALVKELHLRKTAIFNEMITKGEIPLRKGVLRLIDEALEAGVPVGVCSTSSEQAVSNLVRVLMGDERADKIPIYAGDVVKKKKPAPDVYLLAAEKMGLEPAKCVVIEDSSIGLAAGKAAGMNVIVTKSSYAYRENFDLADRVVDDLDAGTVTIGACNELAGSA
jgi:HAD superfamily hydrolase (TIGR01509 family)